MTQHASIPDKDLRVAVLAAFLADGRFASTDLRVGVMSHVVHLAGWVDSLAMRTAAEELAGQVPGVRGVINRIEAPGAPSPSRTIHLDLSHSKEGEDT